MHLAITQPTAKWLLEKPEYRGVLASELMALVGEAYLSRAVLAIGVLRVAASKDGRLLGVWNTDYLSNLGEEPWGLIRLDHSGGLLDVPAVTVEVFERQLHIFNYRLQGLLLPPDFMHRSSDSGYHTCIAGRGTEARHFRVGYYETQVPTGTTMSRAVVCVGPAWEDGPFQETLRRESNTLAPLVRTANELVGSVKSRPVADAGRFPRLQETFTTGRVDIGPLAALEPVAATDDTSSLSYDEWIAAKSPLTPTQRRILQSDLIEHRPVRIVGAAGSGKTLLMMLAAIRRVRVAQEKGQACRVLYAVHNTAMMHKVWSRMVDLGAEPYLGDEAAQRIEVRTLFQYARENLGATDSVIINSDAQETKEFQFAQVAECFDEVLVTSSQKVAKESILYPSIESAEYREVIVSLVVDEIAVAIKGHGLTIEDRARYVGSERRLSRLHGMMDALDRALVFDVFLRYHARVFEELEMFDSDDIALSLLSNMRTPLWEMKRRKIGYDYVLVDETQLFNENERRLFPLLTKGTAGHVPIMLALDEAQQAKSMSQSGLGLLGIESIANEQLESVHRSSPAILALSFFVIQRTTDLFGPDFPDFTALTKASGQVDGDVPSLRRADTELGEALVEIVRGERKRNVRQVCVVCHAESLWSVLRTALSGSGLPLRILEQRGEKVDPYRPVVVLARPRAVGGQEFDSVVAIGLEQGLVPPRVDGNEALASALEQQALREMYLAFTRARQWLTVVVQKGASPTSILQDAIAKGVLK
jgi:hypothetical protein